MSTICLPTWSKPLANTQLPIINGCHDLENTDDSRIRSARSIWCLLATNIQCRQLLKDTPGKSDHYLLRDTLLLNELERFIIRQWPFNKQHLLTTINKLLATSNRLDWLFNKSSYHFFDLLKQLKRQASSPTCTVIHIRAGVWQALMKLDANKALQQAQQDATRLNTIAGRLQSIATSNASGRHSSPCTMLFRALFHKPNTQQLQAYYYKQLANRANNTLTAITHAQNSTVYRITQ